MFQLLKQQMNNENYCEYVADYQRLYRAKSNKTEWSNSQRKRKEIEREPFFKRLFERMSNVYNYKAFKNIVLSTNLKPFIQADENLYLFYCCSIYTGLIIEQVLFDELQRKSVQAVQNWELDVVHKTDLKLFNNSYQIKNKTYLTYKDRLEEYKRHKVQFIFYSLELDNVVFCEQILTADELESVDITDDLGRLTAPELIEKLIRTGSGKA